MNEIILSERLTKLVYEVLETYPQEFIRTIGVARPEGLHSLLKETPKRTGALQRTILRKYPEYADWLTGKTDNLPVNYSMDEESAPILKENVAVYGNGDVNFYRDKYFTLQEKYSKLQEDYITGMNLLHLSKEKIWKLERLLDHNKDLAVEENINIDKARIILKGIEELEMHTFKN